LGADFNFHQQLISQMLCPYPSINNFHDQWCFSPVGVNNRAWRLIPEMIPDPVASPAYPQPTISRIVDLIHEGDFA